MARYSTKSGKRKYYYKRAKSRSTKAITTSRAFKASAANMTQNGKFNVSTKFIKTLNFANGDSAVMEKLDIANYVVLADMHRQLSNVFDQYRVEKCTLKFNLLINSSNLNAGVGHVAFFTACDRSGFATNASVSSMRTYGSYKESTWSANGDTNPPHYVNIGQADLVSKSEYYDSKKKAAFPEVVAGIDLGEAVTQAKAITITCEVDAQIRYRGVRLDTTGVLARV